MLDKKEEEEKQNKNVDYPPIHLNEISYSIACAVVVFVFILTYFVLLRLSPCKSNANGKEKQKRWWKKKKNCYCYTDISGSRKRRFLTFISSTSLLSNTTTTLFRSESFSIKYIYKHLHTFYKTLKSTDFYVQTYTLCIYLGYKRLYTAHTKRKRIL